MVFPLVLLWDVDRVGSSECVDERHLNDGVCLGVDDWRDVVPHGGRV